MELWYSSVVQQVLNMPKDLGSIPKTKRKEKKSCSTLKLSPCWPFSLVFRVAHTRLTCSSAPLTSPPSSLPSHTLQVLGSAKAPSMAWYLLLLLSEIPSLWLLLLNFQSQFKGKLPGFSWPLWNGSPIAPNKGCVYFLHNIKYFLHIYLKRILKIYKYAEK